MKRIIFLLAAFSFFSFSSIAVTDREMEQARTIATHTYLRFANDGSGYLDEVKAVTMADLEKALKPKEKENIKAFKAILVPGDYSSWTKEQLVDFWTNAFASKGLLGKGRIGKSRARKLIGNMKVTEPTAEAAKQPVSETEAPTPDATSALTEIPSVPNDSVTEPAASGAPDLSPLAKAEALALEAAEAEDEPVEKASNYTWVYIVILVILVGVVVGLVVYASNIMKKGDTRNDVFPRQPSTGRKAPEDSESLSKKEGEIMALKGELDGLQRQNAAYRREVETLKQQIAALSKNKPATTHGESLQERIQQPENGKVRSIYLGRVNSKGMFIRADRQVNPGHTFYRLDTTDGYVGSFHIADDIQVWESILMNPSESLSGGCIYPAETPTEGTERVVTDSRGTAVFDNGCWKVMRKAKVHFE